MGNSLKAAGKYEEALENIEKAEQVFVERLGDDHPHVAAVYSAKAYLLGCLGRYTESLTLYKQVSNGEKKEKGKKGKKRREDDGRSSKTWQQAKLVYAALGVKNMRPDPG